LAEFFDGFEEFGSYAENALVAIFQFNGTFQGRGVPVLI
jgi:hypothetical protein